jgi:hypothetical protein
MFGGSIDFVLSLLHSWRHEQSFIQQGGPEKLWCFHVIQLWKAEFRYFAAVWVARLSTAKHLYSPFPNLGLHVGNVFNHKEKGCHKQRSVLVKDVLLSSLHLTESRRITWNEAGRSAVDAFM